jgi:hypothetical protein
LIRIQDDAPALDLQTWHPVLYRPDRGPCFLAAVSPGDLADQALPQFRPVQFATRVLMIPGRVKVWCQNPEGYPDPSQTVFPRISREDSL